MIDLTWRSVSVAIDELFHLALVERNVAERTLRLHRLVQVGCLERATKSQEHFEAATQLLLVKFPSQYEKKYNDDEWLMYERYIPQVLALTRNYNDYQSKSQPLRPNVFFVQLLAVAVKYDSWPPFLFIELSSAAQYMITTPRT